MSIKCIVPVVKFSEYIFKPDAKHGKERVFTSLGYAREHSEVLAEIYARLAAECYVAGNYLLNHQDEHGQRITIAITLNGIGRCDKKHSVLKTGWMLEADNQLRLLAPFSGFAEE